jgi:hypothetical protein
MNLYASHGLEEGQLNDPHHLQSMRAGGQAEDSRTTVLLVQMSASSFSAENSQKEA